MSDGVRRKAMSEQPRLGQCLRATRHRHGLTLQDVVERTGVALSTLSKVENDQMSLTYDKLLQICDGLGIPVTELLSPDRGTRVALTRRSISRPDNTVQQITSNYDYNYLAADLVGKRMVPIVATVKARSVQEFGPLTRHPGEEFVIVLKGEIEVHTDHYAPRRLETGESVYIDLTMGHGFVAVGEGEAVIACICSAPDPDLRRMMVDAMGETPAE